jgi:hypothetical protein
VARIGSRTGALNVFVERPEERRTLGGGKRVLEDNINMDPEEVRWTLDWIDLG